MSNYQLYDFVKDINFHIKNKITIELTSKSEAFITYLFKLKIFQLKNKIKKDHPLFKEQYFLLVMYSTLYVSKKREYEEFKFDNVEIIGGIKMLRKKKLKKLFN